MLIMMNNIAIITARGGSKRIPKKNIKIFKGKPIIAYSITIALQSGLFKKVIVSTDDVEIAEIAKHYGAVVPFLRTPSTSDDQSTTAEVLVEVLQNFKNADSHFDYACCLYPTAPFITRKSLTEAYELITKKEYISVFPICAFGSSIYRGLQLQQNNKVEMIWPENLNKRSQDLPVAYHDAGQFYWITVDKFLKERKLFTNNSGSIILDDLHVQDIDNETDWKIAELKYEALIKK